MEWTIRQHLALCFCFEEQRVQCDRRMYCMHARWCAPRAFIGRRLCPHNALTTAINIASWHCHTLYTFTNRKKIVRGYKTIIKARLARSVLAYSFNCSSRVIRWASFEDMTWIPLVLLSLMLSAVTVETRLDLSIPQFFYKFGTDVGDKIVPVGDGASSAGVNISTGFPFLYGNYRTVFVSTTSTILLLTYLLTYLLTSDLTLGFVLRFPSLLFCDSLV